jgi:hypothetical protein
MELEPFRSWADVIAYARTGAPLYYSAPLDRRPVRLNPGRNMPYSYEVRARTIRVWPPGSVGRGRFRTSDPFTADREHLSRFFKPIEGRLEMNERKGTAMKIAIPNMPMWEQIDGDMDPGTYGGTIAKADGEHIELLKIQPVREYVSDREASEVGFPFWTREAWFDLADLDLSNPDVRSALDAIGMDEDALEKATPTQRALTIASALLDYGRADEGPSGWSDDIIAHDEKVKWATGKIAGSEYLADEDDEFAYEISLDDLDVDYEQYGPEENNPTSGLKVHKRRNDIEITEWTDIEHATGEEQEEGAKVVKQYTEVDIRELFDPNAKHRGVYSADDKNITIVDLAKMDDDEEREKAIVAAAISYMGYYGGEEEYVDAIGD